MNVPATQAANLWYKTYPSENSGVNDSYQNNALTSYSGNTPAIIEMDLVGKYIFRTVDKPNAYRTVVSVEKMVQGDSIRKIRFDYPFEAGTVIVIEGVDAN